VVPVKVTLSVKVVNIAQSGIGVVPHHYTRKLNKQSIPMVEHVRHQKLLLSFQRR